MTLAGSRLATFAQVLMEEIRAHRPELLEAPFTIAEIYQALVPYQTHRTRLGTEMIGDDDEALLRLLTGEGGFLQLESESVKERLLAELEAHNPNLGIFRSFAAAEVHPGPAALAPGPAAGAAAPVPMPTAASAPAPSPLLFADPLDESEVAPPAPAHSAAAPASKCPACSRELPNHPDLRFCSFCGVDVQRPPACTGCGEPLDASWRFCVRCGVPATAS